MSNSHFQTTMAGSAQGYKIIKQISVLLEFMEASAVDVMNVKGAPARTPLNAAIVAHFVTFKHFVANRLPIAPVCQFLATTPVRPVLTNHMLSSTFRRTVFAPAFRRRQKCVELTTTVVANKCNLSHATGIGTLGRTMEDCWCFLVKSFSAVVAVDVRHLCPLVCRVASRAAKYGLYILASTPRLSLKVIAAMITGQGDSFAKGINGALSRAVVDTRLVCFELLPALEAGLEHN